MNFRQDLDSGMDKMKIFMDPKKAFDTVNHDILCGKLWQFEVVSKEVASLLHLNEIMRSMLRCCGDVWLATFTCFLCF